MNTIWANKPQYMNTFYIEIALNNNNIVDKNDIEQKKNVKQQYEVMETHDDSDDLCYKAFHVNIYNYLYHYFTQPHT